MISEIRSLSADWLPIHIKASVSRVLVSQLFGRSVANFFHPMRVIGNWRIARIKRRLAAGWTNPPRVSYSG
ncbi:hypothetical protein P9443_15615 [Peribacillus frigoritolerans]|uniref:hypothetical protein n=1 Tax=Peribacillus frigoritolerans TaxID=450367 RepID=UPI00227FD7A3|nr:hypothetical protein [Peribacillus frigoritolerans]MCY9006416.1 hypothetical protein [Peribacillus frigoritolerans]MED4634328.1 hypothetical protein [Peribacillus frigoritolerans]